MPSTSPNCRVDSGLLEQLMHSPVSFVVVSYVIVSGTPPEAVANVSRIEKPPSRGSLSERDNWEGDRLQAANVPSKSAGQQRVQGITEEPMRESGAG